MRQCAVKFISLQVHSTCFGRHTRPSSGEQFQFYGYNIIITQGGAKVTDCRRRNMLTLMTRTFCVLFYLAIKTKPLEH